MSITPTELARQAEISVSYAWAILKGDRSPSRKVAYRIYDKAGLRFGHLSKLSPDQIETARHLDKVA